MRYYGYFSNVARGKRKKAESDDVIFCILEPALTDREFRRNWARLLQKIFEVDPLVCPECAGPVRVIALIEQAEVSRKIFEHLGPVGDAAQADPEGQRTSRAVHRRGR